MKAVNLMLIVPIYLTMLVALSETQSEKQGRVDVSKQIAKWLGEEPISKGRTSLGWLEVDVYNTRTGQVFVDPDSGEIIMVSLRLKQLGTQKDVGIEKALNCALQWMEQRGISTYGWRLEEKRRYDRGSGGIEYMFTWLKYSPEGVQLPSFMKMLVSGEGEVSYWFRIDKPVSISLTPKISAEEAVLKAQSIVGKEIQPKKPPSLRVWFREKKQQLWWEIVLDSGKTKRDWDAVVIIDAHTGELVEFLRPLGKGWMEEHRQRYLQNAFEVSKELRRCIKIEVFHIYISDKPAAVLKRGDKRFQRLLLAVQKLLTEGKGIIGAPPYGLLAEFQLRFYIAPDVAYEAKMSLRVGYFEILEKVQLKRKNGKEFWQRLEVKSVVVHKCPKEFIREVTEVMKKIPGVRLDVR